MSLKKSITQKIMASSLYDRYMKINKLTTLVSKVVIQDAPVGEKELNELDKVIAECVKTARCSEG